MKKILRKKKDGTGAVGYMLLFGLFIVLTILTMYIVEMSKLITHQHDIDDALADSCLAALVADDTYYFETLEKTGDPVIRIRDRGEAFSNYVSAMKAAVTGTEDFYYNFAFDEFILYEVEGDMVTVTKYTGDHGTGTTTKGTLHNVKTPDGEEVIETSCYAKVTFDIKSILDGSMIGKSRDLYCNLEIDRKDFL